MKHSKEELMDLQVLLNLLQTPHLDESNIKLINSLIAKEIEKVYIARNSVNE